MRGVKRHGMRRIVALGGGALLAFLGAAGVAASRRDSARTAPVIALQPVAAGLGPITSIVHAQDRRLYVTIQNGQIIYLRPGSGVPNLFLDIAPLITCCGERGLLSVAFHPRSFENGFFFVNYTNTVGDTVIARYRISSNPDVADPFSGVILLTIPQPFANHNGGQLQFGPDGYLYIGMGDGGSANDPFCNAQRGETLLGKLLRIDVDQNVGTAPFYGIPPSNPFVGEGGPLDEIWALGLRNPWRFTFDRTTGDLWIGDVGQNEREEIDFQPRSSTGGENYGWKMMEGTLCGSGGESGCPPGVPSCGAAGLVLPRFEYGREGGNCSVTGGYVYRGSRHPQLRGRYVYGDYCSGRLWADGELLAPTVSFLSTFGEDLDGELYVGSITGSLSRIVNPNPVPPPPRRTVVLPSRRSRTPIVVDRGGR